jgi:hypothetical protein
MTGFLSIKDFCAQHALTRGTFYRLRAVSAGPRLTKLRRRTLISQAAAAEWCQDVDGKRLEVAKPALTLADVMRGALGARR